MAHEVRPIGSFPKSEATPNLALKDRSLQELQEMIEWPHKFEEAQAEAAALQPEPEPPQSEPQTPPEPLAEPEPEAPAPEPEATPTPAEPEPSREDIEAEILRAKMEALEAYNRKMEAKMSGREAGERGYIKQLQAKIKELESKVSGAEFEPQPSYDEPVRPQPRSPEPSHEDGFKTWAIRNAIGQAAATFTQTHPDINEVQGDIQKYLAESGYNPESVFLTTDPIAAEREVTRVLDEAYWHVKSSKNQARVAELETRRASQVRGLEEAKKKAAISGSGSTQPAPTPRKAVGDLSLSELEKRMAALNRR